MKKSKKLITSIIMMLIMSAMLLSSCGGPKTLEELMNSDPKLQKEIEDIKSGDNMDIKVKENTITSKYTFENDIPEGMEDVIKADIKERMDSQSEIFENIANQLETDTKIKGIKVKFTYISEGGDVLYTNTYESKEK